MAAIPKSTIQTSPGLTPRIVILHAVKHHSTFQCGLIAESDVRVLIRDRQQLLADGTPVCLAQFGKFFDDLRYAHGRKLNDRTGVVRTKLHPG
ncbi:MAG: hypothetical protein ABSA69_06675 [Verrucomicrobiota bacterium]